jgi:hypothetical protein
MKPLPTILLLILAPLAVLCHGQASEEIQNLYDLRMRIDREEDKDQLEQLERQFLAVYAASVNRNSQFAAEHQDWTMLASLGPWLSEACRYPEDIPTRTRRDLLRCMVPFLDPDKEVAADDLNLARYLGLCGTGRPIHDPFANLARLEPQTLEQLLLTSKDRIEALLVMLTYHAPTRAEPLIVKFAEHPHSGVRSRALNLMTRFNPSYKIDLLQRLSKDPVAQVRMSVLELLWSRDPKDALPIAKSLLHDKVPVISSSARWTVDKLRGVSDPPPSL